MSFNIFYSKKALKDISNLKAAHLDGIAKKLIDIIRDDPFRTPPPYEKLVGNLKGLYSRRINRQHRLLYDFRKDENAVLIMSMWSHYEGN